jgi:RNA polymerase primary sigma factor
MSASLETFFKDVSKTSLLSREEEVSLSQRIEQGDTRARDHMVRANIRLAISIAKKYQHKGCDLEDLIQESNIGLLKAVDRYDWRRGFKFSTYACWWIKQAVRRHVTAQSSSVKLPSYARSMLWKMKQFREEYVKEFDAEPSQEELADLLGVTLKTLKSVISCASSTISLDSPAHYKGLGDAGNRSYREMIPDEGALNVEQLLDSQKIGHLIKEAFKGLTHREEQVIRLRFGISEICDKDSYILSNKQMRALKSQEGK